MQSRPSTLALNLHRLNSRNTPARPPCKTFCWHEFCTFRSEGNVKECAMLANVTSLTVNPMFLHHDLLIELGRLETAIESMRSDSPANDADTLMTLETRRSAINHTLERLSA